MSIARHLADWRKRVQGKSQPDEDARLMQLYWNRAELKKELARLQSENYALLQQLKKNEANRSQAHEQMEALEEFLGKPEHGLNALVFYQLRALWQQGSRRLVELANELGTQQQERERRLQVFDFDQSKQRNLAELEATILDAQSKVDALDAQLQHLQRRMEELRWFWHYRKRRELQADMQPLTQAYIVAQAQLSELQQQREELAATVCPPFPGLSVAGKRLVNTAILAYAQQLLERFGGEGLVTLAKDASFRRVFDLSYGSPAECQHWLNKLHVALSQLQAHPRDMQLLRQTIQRLRGNVFYRSDHDTVPVPETIGMVAIHTVTSSNGQSGMAEEVNVLLDDFWSLYSVLLH